MLDVLVQRRRNTAADDKLLGRLLNNRGSHLETITTDKLASQSTALTRRAAQPRSWKAWKPPGHAARARTIAHRTAPAHPKACRGIME